MLFSVYNSTKLLIFFFHTYTCSSAKNATMNKMHSETRIVYGYIWMKWWLSVLQILYEYNLYIGYVRVHII